MLSVTSIVDICFPSSIWHFHERVRSRWLDFHDPLQTRVGQAALRWRRELGTPFEILLDAAGYTSQAKSQHLKSFATIAVPYFGSNFHTPSSFMTDNGCPVELSWDWGWDGCSPSVRYSMEPLCLPHQRGVGEASREAAGLQFAAHLTSRFGVPLNIFQHFWHSLVLPPTEQTPHSRDIGADMLSQFFAGFDFDNEKFVFKAYFLPSLQARSQGRSRYETIKLALERSPGWSAFATPFSTIDDFMNNTSLRCHLDAEIFSLDVASTSPSRYKLYVRCRLTSFASVREVASLGGRITSEELERSLDQLHLLWLALFQPPYMGEECALPSLAHRTSGILYYFEIRAGKPASTPKIYLPVRHYSSDDAHVERTVSSFVAQQAAAISRDASQSIHQFRVALGRISHVSPMEASKGLHTYIGCTLERGTVKLISYLNPRPGISK